MPETRTSSASERTPPVEEVPPPVVGDGSRQPVCSVAFCPICMAVTAAQVAAPDAVEHLLNAAREFLLAARAVVDARADDVAGRDGARSRTLERIDIA